MSMNDGLWSMVQQLLPPDANFAVVGILAGIVLGHTWYSSCRTRRSRWLCHGLTLAAVVLVSGLIEASMHQVLVHTDPYTERKITAGLWFQPEALERRGSLPMLDFLGKEDAWTNPDVYWSPLSRALSNILFALFASLWVAGGYVIGRRKIAEFLARPKPN
jgi:hypothetical protein